MKILLIDGKIEEKNIAQAIMNISKYGHGITIFKNSKEAVDFIEKGENDFDIVLVRDYIPYSQEKKYKYQPNGLLLLIWLIQINPNIKRGVLLFNKNDEGGLKILDNNETSFNKVPILLAETKHGQEESWILSFIEWLDILSSLFQN